MGVLPARLVDELLQASFDLVVGEKSHVSRVSHRKAVPVPQQRRPRLQMHKNTRSKIDTKHNQRASNENESFSTGGLPVKKKK